MAELYGSRKVCVYRKMGRYSREPCGTLDSGTPKRVANLIVANELVGEAKLEISLNEPSDGISASNALACRSLVEDDKPDPCSGVPCLDETLERPTIGTSDLIVTTEPIEEAQSESSMSSSDEESQ